MAEIQNSKASADLADLCPTTVNDLKCKAAGPKLTPDVIERNMEQSRYTVTSQVHFTVLCFE